MNKNQFGFTFIELMVVIGIIATLFGFVTFNLVRTQKTASVNAVSNGLISDISGQQTKAMLGAGSSSGINYGIYFQSDRYILIEGSTYSSADPKNFTVKLDQGLAITNIKFPNNTLVFSSKSGTVSGFMNNNNYVSIQDINGSKANTVVVNRYGVVIQAN